jgi:glutathionylspermidine synthase
MDEAVRRRDGLLIKPCSYGGSHGVLPGCESAADEWARRIAAIWTDPAWVLQEFHPPRRSTGGQFLSLGLYNYGGQLGGITLRAGRSRNVSARDSVFIPAVAEDAGSESG